jgi:hypothetical protein
MPPPLSAEFPVIVHPVRVIGEFAPSATPRQFRSYPLSQRCL